MWDEMNFYATDNKYSLTLPLATDSAVFPSLRFASLLAPAEIRYLTTSRWPYSDALMSGVFPSLSFAFLLAPIEIRYLTTSSRPEIVAQMSGVPPKPFLASLSSPIEIKYLTISRWDVP